MGNWKLQEEICLKLKRQKQEVRENRAHVLLWAVPQGSWERCHGKKTQNSPIRKYGSVAASTKHRPQAEDFAHRITDDVSRKNWKSFLHASLDFSEYSSALYICCLYVFVCCLTTSSVCFSLSKTHYSIYICSLNVKIKSK